MKKKEIIKITCDASVEYDPTRFNIEEIEEVIKSIDDLEPDTEVDGAEILNFKIIRIDPQSFDHIAILEESWRDKHRWKKKVPKKDLLKVIARVVCEMVVRYDTAITNSFDIIEETHGLEDIDPGVSDVVITSFFENREVEILGDERLKEMDEEDNETKTQEFGAHGEEEDFVEYEETQEEVCEYCKTQQSVQYRPHNGHEFAFLCKYGHWNYR